MFSPIIGLEIHLQLKTKSKVFCKCSTAEAEPNSNICPICLGYSGAMPNLNKEAVLQAIRMGLALNSEITNESNWDRKNYMYPDLFKGYQITQLDDPICGEGSVEVLVRNRKDFYSKDNYTKSVGIFRAHLEEDTAKSIHGPAFASNFAKASLDKKASSGEKSEELTFLDANKAGIPLLEIVSKPEMYSVDEAVSYAKTIRNLARWFNVSDCNLELGEMRFDANISVSVEEMDLKDKKYEDWKGLKFTPIVEIKNMNSFGNLQTALDYEINRQIEEYKKSGEVYKPGNKETRGWDDIRNVTYTQRKKEEANEYRYIPEPDIPTLIITDDELRIIKERMPESPQEVKKDLIEKGVAEQASNLIIEDATKYRIYKELSEIDSVRAANLITNELATEINSFEDFDSSDWILGLKKVLEALNKNEISSTQLKEILKNHKAKENDWNDLLSSNSSSEEVDIESLLKEAFEENPTVVEQIKSGKDSAKMFFVGIIMRETKGKANPNEIKDLIDKLLS